MSKAFQLPEIYKTGRVLVVGMGGGCDVITAYVVAKHLDGLDQSKVMWANTKRGGKGGATASYDGVEPISAKISKVTHSAPLVKGGNYYGTCGIDYSVPKGPQNCPFILTVPRVKDGEKADEEQLKQLGKEITQLGFVDAIIGVDAGGDSVTGGIDHNGDPTTGVDQMCGRALKYCGLPFIHCVPGFGCDGESTLEIIEASLKAETEAGLYMGSLSMISWAASYTQYTGMLAASRTPNIMATACAQVAAGKDKVTKEDGTQVPATVLVDRGLKTQIPVEMLASAYFFMRTV